MLKMQCQNVESKQLLAYVHGTVTFCSVCLKTEDEAKLEPNRRQEMLGAPLSSPESSWLCSWCEMRCRSFERLRNKAQSALTWLHHVRCSPHLVQKNTDYYWTTLQEVKHEGYRTSSTFLTSYLNPQIDHEELGKVEIEIGAVIKQESDMHQNVKQESSLYQKTEHREVNVGGTSPQLEPEMTNENDDNTSRRLSAPFPTDTRPERTASSTKKRQSALRGKLQQPNARIDKQMTAPEHQRRCSGTGAPTESEGKTFTLAGRTITPICARSESNASLAVASGRENYKLKPGDTTITLDENDCVMNIVADVLEGRVGLITLSEEERRAEHAQVLRTGSYQQARHTCAPCGFGYQNKLIYRAHMHQHVERKSRPYRCAICTTYHESAAQLQRHKSEHYTRYYCGACERTFHYSTDIINHYFSEHMSVDFVCKYCYKTFRKPFYLKVQHMGHHMKQTSPLKHIACPKCHKLLSSEAYLQKHMRKHNPEDHKWHECPICHKMCASAFEMKKHVGSHGLPIPHVPCQLCHNTYTSEMGLQSHMQRKHAADTPQRYKCDECGKEFKVKADMRQHISRTHVKFDGLECPQCAKVFVSCIRYKCDECGKEFKVKADMRQHISRTHVKFDGLECPQCAKVFVSCIRYKCDECGKEFKVKADMRQHISRTHVKFDGLECPQCAKVFVSCIRYKCDECGKEFKVKADMRQHISRTHVKFDGLECPQCAKVFVSCIRYKCDECGKEFKVKADMRQHISRTHVKFDGLECPQCAKVFVSCIRYKCDECGKEFKVKADMRQHISRTHVKFDGVECPQCAKVFVSCIRYKCDECGKEFKVKADMRQHISRTHVKFDGVECPQCAKVFVSCIRYKCDECGKEFKVKADMRQHISRTHVKFDGVECPQCAKVFVSCIRYKCDECGKEFKVKADMRQHISRTHVKFDGLECPQCAKVFVSCIRYKCDECGKEFKVKADMRQHISRTHVKFDGLECPQCAKIFVSCIRYKCKTFDVDFFSNKNISNSIPQHVDILKHAQNFSV